MIEVVLVVSAETGMRQKSRIGQNFLVDQQAQLAIADALGDVSQQTVVEIGPGKAAITDILARRARRLIAIELDDTLAAALYTRFLLSNAALGEGLGEARRGVEVLHRDVLKVDLTELAGKYAAPDGAGARTKMAVVGNLPYYITSDILLHLFKHEAVLGRAVLMVQREVADRIVAEPGSRDYGMLSATCQLYARVERLFTLPPAAFSPAPQVHSSVVRLTMSPRFEELGLEAAGFLGYLRVCFAQKRKTLANNLRTAGYAAGAVERALQLAGVALQARAETLSIEQQAQLFLALGTVRHASGQHRAGLPANPVSTGGWMANTHTLIAQAYSAFNQRKVDAALALMSENVSWPKASEGGRVLGKEEIRAYWTRQWQEFDPHVEPVEMIDREEGRTEVKVRQLVKNLKGEVLSDTVVCHVYTIVNGLIERMDLKESEASSDQTPSAAFAKH